MIGVWQVVIGVLIAFCIISGITVLASHLCDDNKEEKISYEYMLFSYSFRDGDGCMYRLNKLGDDGWAVVGYAGSDDYCCYLILERETLKTSKQ